MLGGKTFINSTETQSLSTQSPSSMLNSPFGEGPAELLTQDRHIWLNTGLEVSLTQCHMRLVEALNRIECF